MIMTNEQQTLAWACLPKETRAWLKERYQSMSFIRNMLNEVFGYYNLTSDTELSELLFVEKEKVQGIYQENLIEQHSDSHIQIGVLYELFGDKCLPDTEPSVQVEPKFRKGDKVLVIDDTRAIYSDPMTIKDISLAEDGKYCYNVIEYSIKFHEDNLEPYTESETKTNMEEKELNLVKLLKGCEGEELYSPSYGKCILKAIHIDNNNGSQPLICVTLEDGTHRNFSANGKICWAVDKFAPISLFPYYLYEKYPLDAYSAWMEWKSERTPKRWRAKYGEVYWRVDFACGTRMESDMRVGCDDLCYESLNYFRTEEEAQQAAEAVRECLQKNYEKFKSK